jgi:hypothetical protein
LQGLDRFDLSIVRAVKITFGRPNMRMSHQCLNGSKVIPVIQKGCGKGVPDHMRTNLFPNESLFRHGLGIIPFPSSHEPQSHGFGMKAHSSLPCHFPPSSFFFIP